MKRRGPVFDQNRADAVVVCGSQQEASELRRHAPEVKNCVLWNEEFDPKGVKLVRLWSREKQSEPPLLLTSTQLDLDALAIESRMLPLLDGCSCVSTIRQYLEIAGDGTRARIPTSVCASRLAALWVCGTRTRIDFEPSQFPVLTSLQLSVTDTVRAFDRLAEMLPRLTTFGAWGLSERYCADFRFCSERTSYLRVLNSSIESLSWLDRFPHVEAVHFQSCPKLSDLRALGLLQHLEEVRFWWCPGVRKSQGRFAASAFTVEYVGTSAA